MHRFILFLLLIACSFSFSTEAFAQLETFSVSFEYTRFGDGCRSPTNPSHPEGITVTDLEPVNVRCHAGGGHLSFEWPEENAPDPTRYLTVSLAAEEGEMLSFLETDTLSIMALHLTGIDLQLAYFAEGDSISMGMSSITPDTMRHTFAFDPPVTADSVEIRMYGFNAVSEQANLWIYNMNITMQATNIRVSNEGENVLPGGLAGVNIYPNPLQSSAQFTIEMPAENHAMLTIYDLLGREIKKPVNGWLPAGSHIVEWDASPEASGLYLYRLQVGNQSKTGKLIVIR